LDSCHSSTSGIWGIFLNEEFSPVEGAEKGFNLAANLLVRISKKDTFTNEFPNFQIFNDLIEKYHPFFMKGVRELSNKSEVETIRNIINSSSIIELQPQITEENLRDYLIGNTLLRTEVEHDMNRRTYLEKMNELRKSNKWVVRKIKNGVKLSTISSKTHVVKVEGKINCSTKVIFDFIHNMSVLKSIKGVTAFDLVEKFDDSHSDYYFVVKMPFPFQTRETLFTCWNFFDPVESTLLLFSIDRPDRPQKHVRISTIALTIIQQDPTEPHCSYLEQIYDINMKSSVPHWLIKRAWRSEFEKFERIKILNQRTSKENCKN